MVQHITFAFGFVLLAWRIVSSLRWTVEEVRQKDRSVLRYRLGAYLEVLLLALIFLAGSQYADMSLLWFAFGLFFVGLSLYSTALTLAARVFRTVEKPQALSDKRLKRQIVLRKIARTVSHGVLLCLWIYSWRHILA